MIDYIYLILILILIGFILFIIYLSYEYRIKEGFGTLKSLNPSFNPSFNINYNDISNKATTFNNNYIKFINDQQNVLTSKDYNKQLEILQNTKKNLLNSQSVLTSKNNLIKTSSNDNFPIDKLINTIKSKYNSQYLSTFTNDSSTYGVLVNDKCMTVNGLCKDDFCLLDCQNSLYSSDSQKFTTKRIYTDLDASRAMNIPINNINSKNVYPFNIFRSVVNNNCLTINDQGLTVEKCNLNNIKQQWEISPNENICVLK